MECRNYCLPYFLMLNFDLGHASCLNISQEMVAMIKTYSWQCMDCKKCMMCLDPNDEVMEFKIT